MIIEIPQPDCTEMVATQHIVNITKKLSYKSTDDFIYIINLITGKKLVLNEEMGEKLCKALEVLEQRFWLNPEF